MLRGGGVAFDGRHVWVSYNTDETLFAGTLDDGIFRSTDRGPHWTASNFGLLDWQILSMAISPDFAHDETIAIPVERPAAGRVQ